MSAGDEVAVCGKGSPDGGRLSCNRLRHGRNKRHQVLDAFTFTVLAEWEDGADVFTVGPKPPPPRRLAGKAASIAAAKKAAK